MYNFNGTPTDPHFWLLVENDMPAAGGAWLAVEWADGHPAETDVRASILAGRHGYGRRFRAEWWAQGAVQASVVIVANPVARTVGGGGEVPVVDRSGAPSTESELDRYGEAMVRGVARQNAIGDGSDGGLSSVAALVFHVVQLNDKTRVKEAECVREQSRFEHGVRMLEMQLVDASNREARRNHSPPPVWSHARGVLCARRAAVAAGRATA